MTDERDDVIEEIQRLPKTRPFSCCGRTTQVHALEIYARCPACGRTSKMRGHGAIGTEVEDVIDAVLKWMGTGEDLDRALQRKKAIDES